MLSAVSDDDDRPQWKIDEIILDALEGLDLSDEETKAEFERIRILDEKQIEEELARLEAEKNDEFDSLEYIASNPDLIVAFGGAEDPEEVGTIHYIEHGFAEERPIDEFDSEQYLDNYPDLQAAFGDDTDAATIHYIQFGFAEGRTDEGPDGEGPDNDGFEEVSLAGDIFTVLVPVEVVTAQDFFI